MKSGGDRATEHRLPGRPTGDSRLGRSATDLSSPVALSPPDFKPYCTSLLGVLFSVRSRYLFAIGLGECLALAGDACRIHEGFPTPDTPELAHVVLVSVTGLSPCVAPRSRGLRGYGRTMGTSPIHHIGRSLRFGLYRVHSPLLTTSLNWFLFLRILRCFSSPRSLLREAIAVGIPIRKSRVLRLRAASPGLSQLGTSVVGSRAELSTRRHSSHVCVEVRQDLRCVEIR